MLAVLTSCVGVSLPTNAERVPGVERDACKGAVLPFVEAVLPFRRRCCRLWMQCCHLWKLHCQVWRNAVAYDGEADGEAQICFGVLFTPGAIVLTRDGRPVCEFRIRK